MNPNKSTQRQYFLGTLEPDVRSEIENCYFTDRNFFAEIEATEAEMIDAYLYGELSAEERHQFELHYLASPDRRERVEQLKELKDEILPKYVREWAPDLFVEPVSDQKPVRPTEVPPAVLIPVEGGRSLWERLVEFFGGPVPALQFAMSLTGVVLISGTVFYFYQSNKLEETEATAAAAFDRERAEIRRSAELAQQQLQQQISETKQQLETKQKEVDDLKSQQKNPLKISPVSAVDLEPTTEQPKGGGPESLKTYSLSGLPTVPFHLKLPKATGTVPEYRTFRINLVRNNEYIWEGTQPVPANWKEGITLTIKIPLNLVTQGTYVVKVYGEPGPQDEPYQRYKFQVER